MANERTNEQTQVDLGQCEELSAAIRPENWLLFPGKVDSHIKAEFRDATFVITKLKAKNLKKWLSAQ